MPGKAQQQTKTLNGNAGGVGKSAPSPASAKNAAATSASPVSALSAASSQSLPFNSIPHATSGDRLIGVEVSAGIPALMSEIGELLQKTPSNGSSSGGGVANGLGRGQKGGLLFEHLEATVTSPSEAAAALFAGIDANRHFDQMTPAALEGLSQVFNLHSRQTSFLSSPLGTAAASSAAAKCGSSGGGVDAASGTAEVGETDQDGDMDSVSGSRTGADDVLQAVYRDSAGGHNTSCVAGWRHNMSEMLEMMQRSIGNYARSTNGGAGDKVRDSGSDDIMFDPSTCSDHLTQLELYRAMMVASSKGCGGGASAAAAPEGNTDEGDACSRTSSAGGTGLDSGSANPFRGYLDLLNPQLISQLVLQQRATKSTGVSVGAGKTGETTTPVTASVPREVEMSTSGVANLSDLQQRVEQVRGLSSSTLDALAEDEVSDTTSASLRDLLLCEPTGSTAPGALSPELDLSSARVGYCLTEAAAVAVSMLWSYLGNQQKEAPLLLGYTREEAQRQFNLLLFRLRQELFAQPTASLEEVSRCFGSAVQADPEDIYRAINGVGVLLFFTCKPLPLLEKTCSELRISLSDSANTDCNVMPELIAEKLAAFLYPMKEGKLSFSHLSFIPRLQVHEHAPGNYTCTIDNASNMGRMLRERLLSNRFSCNKIKWRAALANDKGDLKFQVWHRHTTPLSVHLLVRTSEPKKKKRNGGGNAALSSAVGEDKEMIAASVVEELRANSALFMEQQVTAAPGEMVGFAEHFIDLTAALSSPTTLQQGYRTYNKADDRLVFQFSLQLSNMDGAPLEGSAVANPIHKTPAKQTSDDQEPSVSESIEAKTDGGDSKDEPDAEMHAATARLSASETAARGVILEAAKWDYRHLQNDECREAHHARQRAEDRERKALLAKVGPTPELIKEVERLSQSVQAAQQQVTKLNKEKVKDEKEGEKTAEKLAQHQAELTKLLHALESGEAELSQLEVDIKNAEARILEKRARKTRKEAKRAEQSQWTALKRVLEPTSSTTHHDTLAINDFGSFLHSTPIMGTSMSLQPKQQAAGLAGGPPSSSLFGSSLGGIAGMTPLAAGGSNLSAFGTDPFSVRAPLSMSAGGGVANTTPVFSTQPKMTLASSSALGGVNGISDSTSPSVTAGKVAGIQPHTSGLGNTAHGPVSSHPGSVSPKVPPSPVVMSNTSAAMAGSSSPASAVGAPIGSPGMQLSGANGVPGNIGIGGSNGGGGLSFGLAPSLFSTNPVSQVSHIAGGVANATHNTPSSLYTSLDVNAQPFSPSPPPTTSTTTTIPPAAAGGVAATAGPSKAAGNAGSSHTNTNSSNMGYAFTVTAGAHSGLAGGSPSPLYSTCPSGFSGVGTHDVAGHSPSPFSTTSMSAPATNSLYGVNGTGYGSTHDMQQQQQQHSGLLPPQSHNPNEILSFSTGLPWRN